MFNGYYVGFYKIVKNNAISMYYFGGEWDSEYHHPNKELDLRDYLDIGIDNTHIALQNIFDIDNKEIYFTIMTDKPFQMEETDTIEEVSLDEYLKNLKK